MTGYMFLTNCLLEHIVSVKTFELNVDNPSDHLPIQTTLHLSDAPIKVLNNLDNINPGS